MIPLKEVIHALRAKKSLGQNFLTDPNILKRIVESAGPLEGRTVIEIGPGPGGLTREIIKQPCKELILIEHDERAIPYLKELESHFNGKFTLLNIDALSVSLDTLGTAPRKVIANLPYNISVPLLLQLLQHIDSFEGLTLMFQKEVAGRLTAESNTKEYGRLSVMCQWATNVKKLFDLPPGAFIPAPKVTSTVVQLASRSPREDVSWEALERVTKAAFSQRRKMLRASLRELMSTPQDVLEAASISPERRAESLSVSEFCTLTQVWIKSFRHKLLSVSVVSLTLSCPHSDIPFSVEVAQTPEEQARGLMFRTTLPNDGGMLFSYDTPRPVSMWMKNTLIPLDMVFGDRNGRILAIYENTTPFSLDMIGPVTATTYVLEIPAGTVSKHGITKSCAILSKALAR